MTHGQSELSNRGRPLSSTTTHPSRDTSPGSSAVAPSTPSSVRVVPSRLPSSFLPGVQVTTLPSSSRFRFRFCAVNSLEDGLYFNVNLSVLTTSQPSCVDCVNLGTGTLRFRNTIDA